jgi:hypothetical protein
VFFSTSVVKILAALTFLQWNERPRCCITRAPTGRLHRF